MAQRLDPMDKFLLFFFLIITIIVLLCCGCTKEGDVMPTYTAEKGKPSGCNRLTDPKVPWTIGQADCFAGLCDTATILPFDPLPVMSLSFVKNYVNVMAHGSGLRHDQVSIEVREFIAPHSWLAFNQWNEFVSGMEYGTTIDFFRIYVYDENCAPQNVFWTGSVWQNWAQGPTYMQALQIGKKYKFVIGYGPKAHIINGRKMDNLRNAYFFFWYIPRLIETPDLSKGQL